MSGLSDIQSIKALKLAMIGKEKIQTPSGLGYSPPFNVYHDRYSNLFLTDFDTSRYQPTGKTYYVSATGSASNDGLTYATAFSSIGTALSKGDADVIMVGYGIYERSKGFSGYTIFRNVSIKAFGGPVTFSAHDTLTWTVANGYTNTYQATRSLVDWVWDAKTPDSLGDYTRLTKQTSIALVDANPGSWYSDGTTLYVRTSDSRQPDSNIRAYLDVTHAVVSGNVTVYMEGINIEGGTEPIKVTNTTSGEKPTFYAKYCKFKYGSTSNGMTMRGCLSFLFNCETARNYLDGFNYHIQNNVNCTSIEINCTGRNNGYSGVDNNNGSTTHDGNTVVRINGNYYSNYGPNVADVNNSKSWLVNCNSHDSTDTGTGSQVTNYYIDGQMWLDTCTSKGTFYDVVSTFSYSVLYFRNFTSQSNFYVSGGALVKPY